MPSAARDITAELQFTVYGFEKLGSPALVERFVLRKGRSYQPATIHANVGEPKQCYRNATLYAFDHHYATYVEGFIISPDLPFAIQHAWVEVEGKALEVTLGERELIYFGVPFETKLLRAETLKNGFYGLLDTGHGANHELMFRLDPELKGIVEAVRNRSKKW